MEEIYEFLNACGDYFLATCDDGQPHVRPFGTVNIYNGRLYILTGKAKSVSRQLHKSPKLEICAIKGGKWMRVEATAAEDDDREARVSMLDAYPELKSMYSPTTATARYGTCATQRRRCTPSPSLREL